MMYWPGAKKISVKDISIFSSGDHHYLAELNILINFSRGHHENYFEFGTVAQEEMLFI